MKKSILVLGLLFSSSGAFAAGLPCATWIIATSAGNRYCARCTVSGATGEYCTQPDGQPPYGSFNVQLQQMAINGALGQLGGSAGPASGGGEAYNNP